MHEKSGKRVRQADKDEVWNRFASGDQTQFKFLFQTYYRGMYGYGLKLCDRPELVKDSMQELFANIWSRRNRLTHIESPKVYLFVSLRRRIYKKLRESNRYVTARAEKLEKPEISFGAEEIMITKEYKKQQREALHKAVNQLSNREKEVLFLHYYNGMSYGEIEDILSINRQSVRNYIHRAMKTLRAVLDAEIVRIVV